LNALSSIGVDVPSAMLMLTHSAFRKRNRFGLFKHTKAAETLGFPNPPLLSTFQSLQKLNVSGDGFDQC
jgi:hypothetical protein